MAQKFITIKIWQSTRKAAKILAIQQNITLAALLDKLIKEALKEQNVHPNAHQ